MTEMLHQPCKHCRSTNMLKDYSSGDVVCTNCGIVGEERIRDPRPEWKDYNEDEDRAKGRGNAGRCDVFDPHDGNYYCGKILPRNQTHSARSRGSSYAYSQSKLTRTSFQIQHLIAKQEAEENDCNNKPNHNNQEQFSHDQKWSLDRALKYDPLDESILAPTKHREAWLKIQSMHTMLQKAALTLQYLNMVKSNAIVRESALILCKYATKRDGFRVRGVTKNKKSNVQLRALCAAGLYVCGKKRGYTRTLSDVCAAYNDVQLQSDACMGFVDVVVLKPKTVARAIAEFKLEFPDWMKQGGVSAPSSLSPIYHHNQNNKHNIQQTQDRRGGENANDVTMTQPTPSSNASTISTSDDEHNDKVQIKSETTTSMMTISSDKNNDDHATSMDLSTTTTTAMIMTRGEIIANMTEYLVRNLYLPTRAISAISTVVRHCVDQDLDEGSKPTTVISAATLLICSAGGLVEKLARQQADVALENGSAALDSIAFCPCTTFWADVNGSSSSWKRTLSDIQLAVHNCSSQSTILEFYNRVMFPLRAKFLKVAHGSITNDCVCGRCRSFSLSSSSNNDHAHAAVAALGISLAASMMREGVKCSELSMSSSS
mmetsp:Transcript_6445/g.9493  ORF Transcript_6445/g.9493 Transcript_6445/m.9493 type:complete len:600 (-) Transcript_6445:190-1989(-)|eukprot:CAMPEP_0116036090 /NCGR_PEP_ID=MMETSP0321-20121206/20913_1 /TAXON_ID=163516 /ORGANISM="Leptocylindrus danicus var. danicus, Strain B650" /LENGTH=599 /DNA_ID=CAMNT_0003513361 /DNA_START=40 /DNA_END=1839 /DNA_ORIENTATION=+